MSGGFGGAASRIITQLVDRVVTEKLANNKTFQQAAVKTAQQVHKAKQAAAETKTSSSKMSFKNTSLYKSYAPLDAWHYSASLISVSLMLLHSFGDL